MKRKIMLFLLAGILLTLPGFSGAEYAKYQITEGNIWECYPLDAHNTVVVSRLAGEESERAPWYICWYRDGELFRELTGTTGPEDTDRRLLIPYPVLWDGEHLTVCFCARKGELKNSTSGISMGDPDPDNYTVYMAEWTENGLEQTRAVPEPWLDTDSEHTGLVAYGEAGSRKFLCNGKEITISEEIPLDRSKNIIRIIPAGGDVFLLKITDAEKGCCELVCMDQGAERYRTRLPQNEMIPTRSLFPDNNGGFFCMKDFVYGDYSPVYLLHYAADGQFDREVGLYGRELVIHPYEAVTGPEDGLCTIYGTAAANSRNIFIAFAMTVGEDMTVTRLDVREIDPEYGDYGAEILLASDGTPYVLITDLRDWMLYPVLIPFDLLEKSGENYRLTLLQ